MAGEISAERARAEMRELVATARDRGAGRLVIWGGVAVVAFTAAFASWQFAPSRPMSGDTALATASIPAQAAVAVTGSGPALPTARQVGRGITNVPGVSDLSLIQRDIADLRQDLADLRRGLTRYDVANEQIGRRLEALEDQASILGSKLAQVLDGPKPLPPGAPAAATPAPQAAAPAPTPPAKPGMTKLEPALFDNRIGKVAPRPLTPETSGETKVVETVKPVESKPVDPKAVVREVKAAPREAEPEPAPAPAADPATAGKTAAKDAPAPVKPAEATAKDGPTPAKPLEPVAAAPTPAPVVATAPAPVPPPSTPPINATVRPPPTAAEEAQRAQRAAQAAQVQQLAQQMILGQPGGKGLQLPLPANAQLAAAAAAAKRDAAAETTGSVPAGDDGAATKTAFAVDLGGYKSLATLRKGWATTSAKHAGLTKGLTPLGQMKESGGAVEARLVAGPFANAADAVKFCAQVQSAGTACAPSVYVGQPLSP